MPDAIIPNTPFEDHPDRGTVLAETHARPYEALGQVRRVIHFAFLTDQAAAEADRAALVRFCSERGVPGPRPGARHTRASFGVERLRWEQHSEFTTYTWEIIGKIEQPFQPPAMQRAPGMVGVGAPGPHLVSIDLSIVDAPAEVDLAQMFDTTSLAVTVIADGKAMVATDFRADPGGFVRILLHNRGLNDVQLGLAAQTVIEIETYRSFALLGLAEARRQWPATDRIERELVAVTGELRSLPRRDLAADQRMLDRMTALAAELEASAVAANFRFAASEAYEGIVRDRLKALGGKPDGGYPTLDSFLMKRITPAIRTVRALRERQADLSRKLSRAANLLRTRVDIELEGQNRMLLRSMNKRARMQLRLQQTVEGLSVAAISYYVIGLLSYVFRALHGLGLLPIAPEVATGIAVVPMVVVIALAARKLRKTMTEADDKDR